MKICREISVFVLTLAIVYGSCAIFAQKILLPVNNQNTSLEKQSFEKEGFTFEVHWPFNGNILIFTKIEPIVIPQNTLDEKEPLFFCSSDYKEIRYARISQFSKILWLSKQLKTDMVFNCRIQV